MLHPESFGQNFTYICWVLERNWRPPTMVGSSVKNLFGILSIWFGLKCTLQLVYRLFTNLVLKTSGSIFRCPYRFDGTNIPLDTTLSYSNLATMILVHWLSAVIQNTYTGKPLVGISPIGMELTFSKIYPGSMSVSNPVFRGWRSY